MRDTVPANSLATHTFPPARAIAAGPAPTSTVAATVLSGSMRETVPSEAFATQTASSEPTIAAGPFPTPTGIFWSVFGSIRVTVPSPALVTHTEPAAMATPSGSPQRRSCLAHPLSRDRSATTVASSWFATHTEPKPAAIPAGPFPTRIAAPTTSFVEGLIRSTRLWFATETHTRSPATAIPLASPLMSIVSTTARVSGSIFRTVPGREPAAHTAPSPKTIPPRPAAMSALWTTDPSPGSITPTALGPTETSEPPRTATPAVTAPATRDRATAAATMRPRVVRGNPSALRLRGDRGPWAGAGTRRSPSSGSIRITPTGSVSPLKRVCALVHVAHTVQPPGEVGDLSAGQDLAGAGLAAHPRREVEGAPAIPALHGDGLAGVEADADQQRDLWIGQRLVHEPLLERERGPDGLAGRGEHGEGLVAAQLDQLAAEFLDLLAGDLCELRRQLGRGLVTAFLGEHRVAAHVRDEERADLGARRRFAAQVASVFVRPITSMEPTP